MATFNVEQKVLLALLRSGLWKTQGEITGDDWEKADWEDLEKLARVHGVLSFVARGAMQHRNLIPEEYIRIWRGAMLSGVLQNDRLINEQEMVLRWFKEAGVRTAILKGTSSSRYYNQPEVRCLGDIDLLIDAGNLDVVDKILKENGYRVVEKEHGFHTQYSKESLTLEIHYRVTNIPQCDGGVITQEYIDHFLDDIQFVSAYETFFPALSDYHHALMLLLHMERHMYAHGLTLRQICDWAAFVQNCGVEKSTASILDMLARCGLLTYARVLTRLCVDYLGVDYSSVKWCIDESNELATLLLQDVFRISSTQNNIENEGNLFIDRTAVGKENQSRLRGLIGALSRLVYKKYPAVKKYKFLLPLFWTYLPARYWVRSILGSREKRSVLRAFEASNKRKKLYEELQLYKVVR